MTRPALPAAAPGTWQRLASSRLALLLLVGGYLAGGYFVIGYAVPARDGMTVLGLPVDYAVPFIPLTTWLYLSILGLSVKSSVLALDSPALLQRTAVALLVSGTMNFICFALLPLTYPRPPLDGWGNVVGPTPYPILGLPGDTVSLFLTARLYGIDPPSCTFPSFHLTYPVTFMLTLRSAQPQLARLLALSAVLLLLTTWTTKQHFVVDGLAGAVTAWLGYRVALRARPEALP